jgi:hypothetical protein
LRGALPAAFIRTSPQSPFLAIVSRHFKGSPMDSVRDVDAFLLMALALASKRRPAELA